MNRNFRTTIATAAALAATVALAAPVMAQRGRSNERERGAAQSGPQRAGRAEPRSQPQTRPEPRQSQQAPARAAQPQRPERQAPERNVDRPAQAPQQRSSQVERRAPEQARPSQVERRAPDQQRSSPVLQRTPAQPRSSQVERRGPEQPRTSEVQRQPGRDDRSSQGPARATSGPRGQASVPIDRSRTQAQPRQAPQSSTVYRGSQSPRPQYGQYGRPGTYYSSGGYSRTQRSYYGGYSRGYFEVRRPIFVQPYYSFRPRFSIGFGISIGYHVAYPFQYYDPYGFYNHRIGVVPYRSAGYSSYYTRVGGLSFNIDPYDAEVYIDGEYVGVADDFSPGQMPLTLVAGRHQVDLQAEGFGPVSFEITVVAGQVIPYSGTLPYLR